MAAHLAQFDQGYVGQMTLAEMAGGDIKTNTLIVRKGAPSEASAFENPKSVFGPAGNYPGAAESWRRVHGPPDRDLGSDGKAIGKGREPDRLSHEAVAAELTNHLIDGIVFTPGIVATIPELQQAGFRYVHTRAIIPYRSRGGRLVMPILATPTFAAQSTPQANVFPPWQHGENNDATNTLGFRAAVFPHWGDLTVRIDDCSGSRHQIVAATPGGVDIAR